MSGNTLYQQRWVSNQNFSSLAFARKARGLFSSHANMNEPIKNAFCCCSREDPFTQGSPDLSSPSFTHKERSSGVQTALKRFFIKRNRSRFSFKNQYRFLTSSYRQTAIQAFGGHQNVHFQSVVWSIANVEAGLVGCSSVLIRFHSCEDISNSSWCRCTKHHAGSRIAAFLSRIFFHYPGLLIRSRVTVLNIGLFLAGGRRAKRSKNRHEEFSPARTERCMGLIPRALPAFSKRYIVPLVWFPHMIWGCHS